MANQQIVTMNAANEIASESEHSPGVTITVRVRSLPRITEPESARPLNLADGTGHSLSCQKRTSGDWEVLFSRTRETKLMSASSRARSQSPSFNAFHNYPPRLHPVPCRFLVPGAAGRGGVN